jgi:uncharacterized RDD family membrane protein YckC
MQSIPAAPSALHEDEILTSGVLSRRFFAMWIDLVLIALLMGVVYAATAAFGLLTFGLGWYLLPWVPLVPFAYHWLSLISSLSATPGQALMGLVLRRNDNLERPDMIEAAVWIVIYYLTLAVFCPALLIMLFTVRKRGLHDLVSGLVMIRRRALTPPVGYWNTADNR